MEKEKNRHNMYLFYSEMLHFSFKWELITQQHFRQSDHYK